MKVVMIAPNTKTFINFREDLIKDIISLGHEVVAITPEVDEDNILKNLGVRCINIKLEKNSTSIIDNLKYLNNLTKILKKEKPDKVFSYTIKPVIFGSIAAKKAKVKEIYSMITGLGYIYTNNDFKTKILQLICGIEYKKAFKYNKKVIFQNKENMEEFISRKYVNKEKCAVVDGSGVNLNKFKRNALPKENVFLMISRGITQKGIREYFYAAKIVKMKYPKTRFIYLQSNDKTPVTVKYEFVKRYVDENIIEYAIDAKDVVSFYKKSKVFVLPSYYGEGIPRTLLEALAMGRPIITTDNVGCKETVIDGKNGYIIPKKNYRVLADKMKYLIENPKLMDKMSDESFNYCKKRFDVKLINKEMLKIMEIK